MAAPPMVVDWPVQLGIRAQLLLALSALLMLAFAPLFFATASLTRAGVTRSWQRYATTTGRLVARHVALAQAHAPTTPPSEVLAAELSGQVVALASYQPSGARVALAGPPMWRDELPTSLPAESEPRLIKLADGTALLVIGQNDAGSVAVLLRADPDTLRITPLLSLVALYTGLLALALLVFLYLVLTRLVVTPIERLSHAAARVADGARELEVPRAGGRELLELGSSLASMTAALVAEEKALLAKVAELGATAENLKRARDTVIRGERLASVGRLAAGLAHEIGNPLTAILGLQELVLDGDGLDDESRDFVERMRRETERVHLVLRDLLTFARPTAGDQRDESEPRCRLAEVIDDVVTLVRPQKAFNDIALLVVVQDDLPEAAMHADQVEQVLLNLLLNAADAVSRPDGHVWLRATLLDDSLRLEVEDDGGGVADSVLASLFEPFVTTKEVGRGTGLGLAVCRGLVDAAGGSLDHERGQAGARFVLLLPVAPPKT